MHLYHLLTILTALATIFSYLNFKLLKWPTPIGLLIFSLTAAILLLPLSHYFPGITFQVKRTVSQISFYDLLIKVFLGFILFAGAYRVSVIALKKEIKAIMLLAFFSTIISTFIVGGLTYYLLTFFELNFSFLQCLLFGSLISPTDPVAVLGILQKLGVPASIEMKITGESLFNDGIAIVLFTTILQIISSGSNTSSIESISLLFVKETIGGVLLGCALSAIGFVILRSIDDYKVEILITLVLVMIGYTLADTISVSAPIAIVITGLITGSKTKNSVMSEQTQQYVANFWELLDDFLNLILFLIIGFEFLVLPVASSVYVISALSILVILIARYLSVLFPVLAFRRLFEKKSSIVLTWCALRGGVSIALALSMPVGTYRSYFVVMTYVIAVFSIVVQGLTMGKLIKKLNLQ